MEIKIHAYQISILRELLFKSRARFSELKKVDATNDHFSFHLNQLVKEGLIEKTNGLYSLTTAGKEFANRMDTDSLTLEKQAKLAIAVHAVRVRNGVTEYLIHRRLKEPFYGWYGSHSGKIRWGENPDECARREFLEETGLTGEFTLKAIVHYHHYHADGRFLEDKYFWVYRVDNTQGTLREKVQEGENLWMTEEQYKNLPHTFGTFEELQRVLTSKEMYYVDKKKIVDTY
jgi:8-oxo-dGTP diphosphatase